MLVVTVSLLAISLPQGFEVMKAWTLERLLQTLGLCDCWRWEWVSMENPGGLHSSAGLACPPPFPRRPKCGKPLALAAECSLGVWTGSPAIALVLWHPPGLLAALPRGRAYAVGGASWG